MLIWRFCQTWQNKWQKESVNPETEEEKLCFKLINDLDHVNGHVPGSITQKTIYEKWNMVFNLIF